MGQATQLSEVQPAPRVPQGWAGSTAGLWFAKAACRDSSPHLYRGRAPLSDVEARQLVDWPHAPGRVLCNHGNSSVGRQDQSCLVHKGVAQPSPSPPAQLAIQPQLRALQWASGTRCPARCGQGTCGLSSGEHHVLVAGPRAGVGDKRAQANLGCIYRSGVCRSSQIEACWIHRQVPFGGSGGPAYLWEVHSHGPRPWGFSFSNWPDFLHLSTIGVGQWTPTPDTEV